MTRLSIRATYRSIRAGQGYNLKPGVPIEQLDKTLPHRSSCTQYSHRDTLILQSQSPAKGMVK